MDSIQCCDEWKGMLKSVLFTEAELISRIDKLAKQLSDDYAGRRKVDIS